MKQAAKRVLLVADVQGWCFWHWCRGIAKYAPRGYLVRVIDQAMFHRYCNEDRQELESYDAVLQCSWTEATFPSKKNRVKIKRNVGLVASHGIEHPWPRVSDDYRALIATSLRNLANAQARLPKFDAVICVNQSLRRAAWQIGADATFLLPGVDRHVFRPTRLPPESDRLKVGWIGQSGGLTKGFKEILRPLVLDVPEVDFETLTNDYTNAKCPTEVAKFYARQHLFLSTSCSEGCTATIPEALSCGRPVIATCVGAAAEFIKIGKNGYLVPGYSNSVEAKGTRQSIHAALDSFREQYGLLQNFARRADESMAERDWRAQAPLWLKVICGEDE